ncbi:hypothetical protein OSB04_015821 [Centaurea solstitialis]|uniref:F-box domain-containing protein n=1 Tax=Centaurea solstitialis TaxID=347529 RepID=A0AA38TD22_9ASTR|nr:hypothetical protein OSB04_015821 [Centaurea solstitialis]
MEELPAELMMDILSRLPVKTIIHCKLVCKNWRNLVSDRGGPRNFFQRNGPVARATGTSKVGPPLVSDSSFVNLHLSRSRAPTDFNFIIHNHAYANYKNPGKLQLMEIEDKVDHRHLHYHRLFIVDLNLVPSLKKTRICHVGSVNGLICLWHRSLNHDCTYICNLVTRECMILPRQPFFRDSFVGVVFCFGVSSPTGEYKVVRASHRKTLPNANKPSQPSLLLEVERSRGPVPVPYWLHPFRNFKGTFLNNHCHWIVCDVENTNKKIETFQLFPSPPSAKDHRQSLAILRGCLCKLDACDSQMTIWVMKEYGIKNSWHKEVVITREIMVDLVRSFFKSIHLIEGLRDGRILMVFETNYVYLIHELKPLKTQKCLSLA